MFSYYFKELLLRGSPPPVCLKFRLSRNSNTIYFGLLFQIFKKTILSSIQQDSPVYDIMLHLIYSFTGAVNITALQNLQLLQKIQVVVVERMENAIIMFRDIRCELQLNKKKFEKRPQAYLKKPLLYYN